MTSRSKSRSRSRKPRGRKKVKVVSIMKKKGRKSSVKASIARVKKFGFKNSKRKSSGLQVMSASAIPAVKGSVIQQRGPVVNRGRGFHVRHSEYLQDIIATSSFTGTVYNLNAGLIDSFPWLGGIAALFETWLPHKMTFEFQSFCATTTVCSIAMATQLDVEDVAFASYEEMMGYQGAITGPAWKSFSHNCLRGGMKTLFTRTGPAAGDPRLYDYGNFTIATEKGSNGQNLGRLIVHYDVELFTPKITLAGALNFWQAINVLFNNVTTTSIQNTPFSNRSPAGGVFPTNWTAVIDNLITFTQVGTYFFEAYWGANDADDTGPVYESATVHNTRPLLVSADGKGTVDKTASSVTIGEYLEQDGKTFTPQGGNYEDPENAGIGGITFTCLLTVLAFGATFGFNAGTLNLRTGGTFDNVMNGVVKWTLVNAANGFAAPLEAKKKQKIHLTTNAKKAYLAKYKMDLYGKSMAEHNIVEVPDGWVHPSFPRDLKDGFGHYINPNFGPMTQREKKIASLMQRPSEQHEDSPPFERKTVIEKPRVDSDFEVDDFTVAREVELSTPIRPVVPPLTIIPLIPSGGLVSSSSPIPKKASRK